MRKHETRVVPINNQERVIDFKHKLFGALLEKPSQYWTDNEVELAYLLSKDVDIQKTLTILRKAQNNENKTSKQAK